MTNPGMIDQEIGDSRLNDLRQSPDCFCCGKKITRPAEGVYVSSPRAGNLKLAAHRECVAGKESLDIAARYQKALWAALGGSKELAS